MPSDATPPPALPAQDLTVGATEGPVVQAIRDREHLKLLSVGYYVMAGMKVFGSLILVLYIMMGGMMMAGGFYDASQDREDAAVFQMMGGIMVAGSVLLIALLWLQAFLECVVAQRLVQCRSRTFCFVVAGIGCLNFPFGMLLGVFTFLVLSRPSVSRCFDRQREGEI